MSWLGKALGGAVGFMLGGPLGAVLGASVGHRFDAGQDAKLREESLQPGDPQRVQMAFFSATFSIMGHLAKIDGRVSAPEIELANRIMDRMALTTEMRKAAIALFQQGKEPDFPLHEALAQFRRECHRRRQLIRLFMDIQIQAALADGMLDDAEESVLLHCCASLGVSRLEYETIKLQCLAQRRFYGYSQQRHSADHLAVSKLDAAYAVLGLSASAGNDEVKKAYRRLIGQHHPDKLVAKGLPEEMMIIAKEKTQQIRKAYETIREARGI